MKISDAKDIYEKYRDTFLEEAQEIFEYFQDHDCEHGLRNDTYLHALALTEVMFQNTKFRLRMLAGPGGDGFLRILRDSFRRTLARILRNGEGDARIIIAGKRVSKEDKNSITDIESEFGDVLTVIDREPPEGANIRHYITCDSFMIREEDYHESLSDGLLVDKVKATVYFNNRRKAKAIENRFDETWKLLGGK